MLTIVKKKCTSKKKYYFHKSLEEIFLFATTKELQCKNWLQMIVFIVVKSSIQVICFYLKKPNFYIVTLTFCVYFTIFSPKGNKRLL
jgi:hypothetical protein